MKNPGLGFSFSTTALVLLLLDLYVLFVPMHDSPWLLRCLFLLPSLIYIVAIARVFIFRKNSQTDLNVVLWLTLVFFFPVLLFDVISAFGRLVALLWPFALTVFDIAGASVAAAWMAMSLYGICVGWKKVTVDSVELKFPRLPAAFEGYRIVHLSDFHIGTYSSAPSTVDRIVEKVDALNPDLIVFTGDLVNRESAEIDPFVDTLKRLRASDGVLSVLGNHDYCLYRKYSGSDSPAKELARVIQLEEAAGWTVLRNRSVGITRGDDEIYVVGVENAGSKGFPDHSDLDKALGGIPAGAFKILLSHDPTHWRREVVPDTDIPLTLAGHTHGMQFKLGRFTPSRLGYREWGGVYTLGKHTLVVSTGIGGNVAFRFGIYPQILLLTLKG